MRHRDGVGRCFSGGLEKLSGNTQGEAQMLRTGPHRWAVGGELQVGQTTVNLLLINSSHELQELT